jgi:hypothetical protein
MMSLYLYCFLLAGLRLHYLDVEVIGRYSLWELSLTAALMPGWACLGFGWEGSNSCTAGWECLN